MDVPLINMGSQNVFVPPFGYLVGKPPPDLVRLFPSVPSRWFKKKARQG